MESLASAALPISYGLSGLLIGFFRGRLPLFFLLIGGLSLLVAVVVLLRGRLSRFVNGAGEAERSMGRSEEEW
jgi:hypothetical protein